ncbi:MAG TPA: ABC transporter ATP-binding protein [Bacteroidia bacterium]|nr:ABC transporter ATP-binding protein [Bacteroidia bacterium]
MLIKTKDIHKYYGQLHVLKGINMEIAKSEVVSIVGASGAGKTTLLQIIGTLDKPDKGSVEVNGTDISKLNPSKMAAFRNNSIGFIFQFHHLLPEFTALENICIPGMIARRSGKELEKRGLELLDYLNLSSRANHKPSELSGGEQQRVAVARALVNNPDIILADEPSGNLDSTNARELHELFFRLRKEFGQTFIIVTHNEELANMADRKLHMKDGVMEI